MSFLRRPFKYVDFHASLYIIVLNFVVFLLTYFMPQLKFYLSLNVGLVVYRKMYWQFLTYMFIHQGFMHIFFNMLGLLFFGFAIEKAIGSKEFLLFYFICGIASGLFSFIIYYFTGSYRIFLMGASGAIYAVLFAYAVCFPRSRLYVWGILPVPAPILVLAYAIIEVVEQFVSSSNIAHMTHLFGFAAAWLYFLIRMGINPIKIWRNNY